MKRFSLFVLIVLSLAGVQKSYAQARSSVGLNLMVNKPFADSYRFGTGFALQGTIALGSNWAIAPEVGYDKVNRSKAVYNSPVDGPISLYGNVSSLDLFTFDLAARYYILPSLYAKLGPMLYAAGGNEDLAGLGIGGTAGLGYQLLLDKRNKLEFSLNTDLINVTRSVGNGATPIAGIRIGYAFNFKAE